METFGKWLVEYAGSLIGGATWIAIVWFLEMAPTWQLAAGLAGAAALVAFIGFLFQAIATDARSRS